MTNQQATRSLLLAAALAGALASSGCGIFLGNVRPVEEKSDSYGVLDLSKDDPDWLRLDPAEGETEARDPETRPSEVADVAYQSKSTASIISLNSACRASNEEQSDLVKFTDLLLMGITEVKDRRQKELTVEGTPALETTIQGKLSGETMTLRTVVLRRGPCIYDLMLVARPEQFQQNEDEFSRFVSSLRLR